jgi:CRP-like cAMP-binding protein
MSLAGLDLLSASRPHQESRSNLVLAGLSPSVHSLIDKRLEERKFRDGALIWDCSDPPAQIVFPCSGMISVRVVMRDGHELEVATVGREGGLGFQDGSAGVLTRAVAQGPSRCLCISQKAFAAAAHESEEIRRVAEECRAWVLLQTQQIAACNAVHSANRRFCRWLLRASDALDKNTIFATQEAIGQSLGIRRTTATVIAHEMQTQGTIRYSRGKISICDRTRLQAGACDCYLTLAPAYWPSQRLIA